MRTTIPVLVFAIAVLVALGLAHAERNAMRRAVDEAKRDLLAVEELWTQDMQRLERALEEVRQTAILERTRVDALFMDLKAQAHSHTVVNRTDPRVLQPRQRMFER